MINDDGGIISNDVDDWSKPKSLKPWLIGFYFNSVYVYQLIVWKNKYG